jgi:hypothetical protein
MDQKFQLAPMRSAAEIFRQTSITIIVAAQSSPSQCFIYLDVHTSTRSSSSMSSIPSPYRLELGIMSDVMSSWIHPCRHQLNISIILTIDTHVTQIGPHCNNM